MVRVPKINTVFFLFVLQPDHYHCGCVQGFECRRYRNSYYWGKCSCYSDTSCQKTHCCSGGQCKPKKKANGYCPLKGVKRLDAFENNYGAKVWGRCNESACLLRVICGLSLLLVFVPWACSSRMSRKLFGPEKPFLKLPSAYYRKPVFYYDFKVRKGKICCKISCLETSSFLRYVGNYGTRNRLEKFRGVRETHA